jgi:hypothetical protein
LRLSLSSTGGLLVLLVCALFLSSLFLPFPFLDFFFSGRGRLNRIYLISLAGGRGRRWSILNIRRNGVGVVARGLDGMMLGMESANHIVSCMRSRMSS